MELNTEYYNNLTKVRGFEVTPLWTGDVDTMPFPMNKQIDESGAYALSRGKYAPYDSMRAFYISDSLWDGIYQRDYKDSIGYIRHYILSPHTLPVQSYAGGNYLNSGAEGSKFPETSYSNGVTTDFGSYGTSNRNALKWGYDVVSDEGSRYRWQGIAVKFAYTELCLYVTVAGYNSDFTQFQNETSLSNYDFDTYPNVTAISTYLLFDRNDGTSGGRIMSNAICAQDWEYTYAGLETELTTLKELPDLPQSYGLMDISNIKLFGGSDYTYHWESYREQQPIISSLPELSAYKMDKANAKIWLHIPNCTYDTVCRIVSTLGLYFADDYTTARDAVLGVNCTNPKIHLGRMSEAGFYEGDYLSGADTATLPQAQWTQKDGSWYAENGVTPSPDVNNYVDSVELSKPNLTTLGAFNRTYAVNKINVNSLADFLWNADDDIFTQIVEGLKLFGEKPMNAVIDLRLYPFNILDKAEHTAGENIKLGRVVTDVVGVKLTNATNCIIDLGSCDFREYFKNFLDFEPYTSATLYIPYVGTMTLPPEKYLGHKLSVKLIVDFTTGAGTAVVFADNIITAFQQGTIGIDISMSGSDSTVIASNAINGTLSGVSRLASGVSSTLSGDLVDGGLSLANAGNKLIGGFAQPTPIQTVGAGTPATSIWQPQSCYLLIESPIVNAPDGYGHNIGYACEFTTTLGNVSGFTVCTNMYFDMQYTTRPVQALPTTAQRDEICKFLNSGVYL